MQKDYSNVPLFVYRKVCLCHISGRNYCRGETKKGKCMVRHLVDRWIVVCSSVDESEQCLHF